jgi:hypothetical protein
MKYHYNNNGHAITYDSGSRTFYVDGSKIGVLKIHTVDIKDGWWIRCSVMDNGGWFTAYAIVVDKKFVVDIKLILYIISDVYGISIQQVMSDHTNYLSVMYSASLTELVETDKCGYDKLSVIFC